MKIKVQTNNNAGQPQGVAPTVSKAQNLRVNAVRPYKYLVPFFIFLPL